MDSILINTDQIWVDDSLIVYRTRLTNELPRHARNEPCIVATQEKDGKPYRLIAGHRQFQRQQGNGASSVQCYVSSETDEYGIKLAHFAHAIQHEGLTQVEIANGIKATFTRNETDELVAELLNRQKWKIVVWRKLYRLPDSTKAVVDANDACLKEDDIKILTQIERSSIPFYLRRCTLQPLRNKSVGPRRTSQEIHRMMQHAYEVIGGNNPIAAGLMWSLCNLSNEQLETIIRDEQHRLSLTRDSN